MLSETLQDRAALYVAGAMTAPERENFELVLEFHDGLQTHVASLLKVGTAMLLARREKHPAPPSELKQRLLSALDSRPRLTEPEPMVVADPAGRVQRVNAAFTAMCGYTLEELQGRKPGHLLQGPETDQSVVQRIRESLQAKQACRESLINYHKDGTRYRVQVAITPILDDGGELLWFVAKERKLEMIA
jgi:PAS domain S-box-containing protein